MHAEKVIGAKQKKIMSTVMNEIWHMQNTEKKIGQLTKEGITI